MSHPDHAPGADAPDHEMAPDASWLPRWLTGLVRRTGIYAGILLLIAIFVLLLFAKRVFYFVGSGQRGVRWSLISGTDFDHAYPEGLRVVAPWDRVYLYDVRVQEVHDTITVLSSNGLPMRVTYSVRYQPDLRTLAQLHATYGEHYLDTLLKPEIVGALREVLGNYRPEEVYSRSEEGLTAEIYQALASAVTDRYIIIQTVLLEDLRMTTELEAAINQKLVDEQNALAYEFRLRRETSEAQRKEIEARGIRAFNTTSGIDILKWRGLEATQALAASPNAKVIVIGPGSGQLPVILGADK